MSNPMGINAVLHHEKAVKRIDSHLISLDICLHYIDGENGMFFFLLSGIQHREKAS